MSRDLIDRQEVINALDHIIKNGAKSRYSLEHPITVECMRKYIMSLPSAEPEPKEADSGSITCMKSENTHVRTTDDCISRQAAIDALKICDNNEDGINCHKCPLRDERWDGAWEDNETNCYTKLMRDSAKLLELPSAEPERLTDDDFETIRIHLNAYKEKLCNQRRWKEAEEYQRIIDRFMAFASAQPDAPDTNVGDKISKFIDGLEETFAYIREREGGDSVCGLCEYNGAYIGESGDWCNECPGFNRDDCFKLSDETRKKWTEEIIKALPSAQPERKRGEWDDIGGVIRYGCPFCHHAQERKSNFCPNCGADMRGEQE